MAVPTITYRPEQDLIRTGDAYSYYTSKWNALHNPVVYKLLNDKWPTNNLDTPESITAHATNLGLVEFTVTGHTFDALEWVRVKDSDIASYNGVWQITEVDTNVLTLDLPYEAGTLGSPTIEPYYQNYHNIVSIYAGFPAGHPLVSEKPTALIAQIKLKPNGDNITIVDVAGIVRDTVNLDNDMLEDDVNIWTSFYIKYKESYDIVSAGVIQQFISSETDDSANVYYGVNAKRAFQNEYGGNMDVYVMNNDSNHNFLTRSSRIFAGYYFDLSFIVDENVTYADYYVVEYDRNSNSIQEAGTVILNSASEGVYRVRLDSYSFSPQTAFFDVYLRDSGGFQISDTKRIYLETGCSRQDIYLTWLNNLGGWEYWKFTAEKDYTLKIENQEVFNKNIFEDWDNNFTGDTWQAVSSIDAREGLRVRSQLLTLEEVQFISTIKHSIKVQELKVGFYPSFTYTFPILLDSIETLELKTVILNKSDLKIRQDGDKLFSIEFDLTYTDLIPVQSA